jgi:hypothetical protein
VRLAGGSSERNLLVMTASLPMSHSSIIREGVVDDIPAIMRLKLELAISDGIAYTVRATAADWERDGFGPNRRFTVFVAEQAARVIGIAHLRRPGITRAGSARR